MKKILKLTAVLIFVQLTQLQAQTSGSSNVEKANALPSSATTYDQTADRKTWQNNISLNPGVSFDNGGIALGAEFQVERRLTDLLGLTFSAGFTTITQEAFSSVIDHNLIPLKIGVKIYTGKTYYLAGAVGTAIDINGNSYTAWSATLAKQLSRKFDLGLKYENIYNSGLLSVRLGYRIF